MRGIQNFQPQIYDEGGNFKPMTDYNYQNPPEREPEPEPEQNSFNFTQFGYEQYENVLNYLISILNPPQLKMMTLDQFKSNELFPHCNNIKLQSLMFIILQQDQHNPPLQEDLINLNLFASCYQTFLQL